MGEVPVVGLRGVRKAYAAGANALAGVDLAVAPGEFLSLLGPSGCGKTTLLNIVAGLVAPTAGTVRWWGGGLDGTGAPGRRMGYVFQSPTLMPWARVDANVRLALDLAGVPRADAQPRVDDALRQVGLERHAHHVPRELSGGMQMRASIARALVTNPDLLLMDEPFGALDEFTRHRLDADLRALWRSRGLTVLFVTHSIAEAAFLSTRIVVMGAAPGRVIADVRHDAGEPRDASFRTSPAFVACCARLSQAIEDAGRAALDASR